MSDNTARRGYHHGDLRAQLIRDGLAVLAETGALGFSVAKVAARAGVSSGAPYRHFRDREALLAACAATVAHELADRLAESARAAGDDPVEQLAATAGAYALYVAQHRVGLELIYADGFQDPRYRELHEAGRHFVDVLLPLATAASTADTVLGVIELLEAHLSLAHGYATLQLQGAFGRYRRSPGDLPRLATTAARALITGRSTAVATG
ncbi:TetR/AcrR family transcriptional regulator [Streptomyces sp. NPDC058466]|uniref:TetR/AcrR family transcriptional regulator n=1 Tax=unclassified Streptomyces TaxID=2593676 RepID=UPI00364B256F